MQVHSPLTPEITYAPGFLLKMHLLYQRIKNDAAFGQVKREQDKLKTQQ